MVVPKRVIPITQRSKIHKRHLKRSLSKEGDLIFYRQDRSVGHSD